VFTARGRGWPPEADGEVGARPVKDVKVATEAAKKWSAWSSTESGSETNYFYNISLTVPDAQEAVVVQCPRTDSARATIQALEDATGSKPSRITARRWKKQQREREARRRGRALRTAGGRRKGRRVVGAAASSSPSDCDDLRACIREWLAGPIPELILDFHAGSGQERRRRLRVKKPQSAAADSCSTPVGARERRGELNAVPVDRRLDFVRHPQSTNTWNAWPVMTTRSNC
jgi:hypothetical protein